MAKEKNISQDSEQKRHALVSEILQRETFIDPLNGDEMVRAYTTYENEPQNIVDALVANLQMYCRKCIRETALIKVKDELALMSLEDAESFKTVTIEKAYKIIQEDPALEQLLMLTLFKTRFWAWSRTGLKDIFNELREQPGNKLNSYFNSRFQKLKNEKSFKKVGDLVNHDATIIVNQFKAKILKKESSIF